jgi:hypothetical protein
MTAPVRHPEIRLDALEVFKLRCWARAYLWAACELDLHAAVDKLQADAVESGLVDEIGQNAVDITARKRFSVAPKLVMTVFPLGGACSNRGAK